EPLRDLPIVLKENSERAYHCVFAVLVSQSATGRPTEHELRQPISGIAAILRIRGELAIERELAAREPCGVAINVLVLELHPRLETMRARRAKQDVVELQQVQ